MTQRFGDDPQSIPGGRVIAKAIIKTYTAGTHKADVQLVGSHPTLLSALRVATNIPADDVVAGRQCTVLFLDPSNHDDAVVLTIQGALPSGGGGGTTDHAALTNLAYAGAAHTGFGGTGIANTWAALQTFSAGLKLAAAQQIQDSGGTGRILLATASPHVTIDGNTRLGLYNAIGADPTTTPTRKKLYIEANEGSIAESYAFIDMVLASLTLNTNTKNILGLNASAIATLASGVTGMNATGLNFVGGFTGGGAGTTVTAITAIWARCAAFLFTGTITNMIGLDLVLPSIFGGAPIITNSIGVRIGDFGAGLAAVATATGLIIGDQTGAGTRRLIEAGPATPNLRLEAGAPSNPGAGLGRSQLLLSFNENGVVSLRRVQWKNPDATGHMAAADKILVAV